MIRYVFADAPLTLKNAKKASPQKIGETLAKITADAGGELKPKLVVDAARATNSPLHRHFEWDNGKAAEAFRIEQAREIIRVVRVEIDNMPATRAFLSVSDKKTSYRTVQEVRGSEHLQSLVLKQADRDLEAFQRRYADLVEVCDDVMEARGKIKKRQTEAENRAN